MAKKVFTLAPNIYFGKQLSRGGRNEIAWTLVGIIKNLFQVAHYFIGE